MLCSVVTCYLVLLHDVQCCCHVTKGYYMLCNVVTPGIVLLNFVQQCYML